MKKSTYPRVINILMMLIAILLTDLFWVVEEGWLHWIGLIGYGIIGWYWRMD